MRRMIGRSVPNVSPKGRQETQLALQRTLAKLSLTRSPGSISVKEIADAAGVTAGLVHYYYETKDQLVGATLVMLADDLLEPINTDDPREIAQAFLEGLAANPSFARIGSWMILNGFSPKFDMDRFPLTQRLRETMEPGDDRDVRIASMLSVVLASAFFAPVISDALDTAYADVVDTLGVIIRDLTR